MRDNRLFRWFYILLIISFLFSSCTDGKGFGGRGGGGFKGGSRGGGIFGGSKGTGTFGGSSGYNRGNTYGSRSGSGFRKNAMSFGAGAVGGLAAYSLMKSMSHSYHPGYYGPGYGIGETCRNYEDMNGTVFGEFRCPLNGFPYEAKHCCGEYRKQYCCVREGTGRLVRNTPHFGWILLLLLCVLICILLYVKQRRQNQKGVIMIPMEPPPNEHQRTPFYQPPPPTMGYPPPPQTGNPYAQQYQPAPYEPQQQSYNPYQPVKEAAPPAYDDAMRNIQGAPSTTKPI